MAREGSLTYDTGDGRIDQEVLSNRPGTERPPWRPQTWVVVTALTMMLPVSLAVHEAGSSNQSATSGASGHDQSHAKSSGSLDLVALVRSRCPHVRRLRLGDVDTLLSVEIAPCSTGRRLGPDASCSQDAVSIRFARIVAVRPGTDGRHNEWVEVRGPTGRARCRTPALGH
jgi:hypothetical protein